MRRQTLKSETVPVHAKPIWNWNRSRRMEPVHCGRPQRCADRLLREQRPADRGQ